MHIQRTDISSTKIKLTISATEKDLTPIKDQVVERLGKDLKLPGFRKGKAPAALIEKNIDSALLQGDFLDEAMTQLYAHATKSENVRPVTRPEVNVTKFVPFTQLEYEVTTNIIGEIKLPKISSLNVERKAVSVTAADVNDVLKSLQSRMATKEEVQRAAKTGDEAVIYFKGENAKGEPIEGAEGDDYPLQLGSGSFIPGFEDNVVGMKPGEEKLFDIKFPADYTAKDLAGKSAKFKVKVHKVNKLVEPKSDDEFAAKVGPFASIDELKKDIKRQLTDERERESLSNFQNEVLKELSDKSTVEIPPELIEQQVQYNVEDVRRNVTSQGKTYQEFLEAEGKTEEQHREDLKGPSEEQLKASLILSEIADRENITVEPEELQMQIQLMKGQYKDQAMQQELDKPENQRDIASRMLSEKTINYIISQLPKK